MKMSLSADEKVIKDSVLKGEDHSRVIRCARLKAKNLRRVQYHVSGISFHH